MSEEIRYKISYDQSVSTGYIGFHGSVEYSGDANPIYESNRLRQILSDAEDIFRKAGYKVASDIVPKESKK